MSLGVSHTREAPEVVIVVVAPSNDKRRATNAAAQNFDVLRMIDPDQRPQFRGDVREPITSEGDHVKERTRGHLLSSVQNT